MAADLSGNGKGTMVPTTGLACHPAIGMLRQILSGNDSGVSIRPGPLPVGDKYYGFLCSHDSGILVTENHAHVSSGRNNSPDTGLCLDRLHNLINFSFSSIPIRNSELFH